MTTRTLEEINNDYNDIQNKIISFKNDIKTLRTDLEKLVQVTTIDDNEQFINELTSLLDKLKTYENYQIELSIKKIKLIQEFGSQLQQQQ
jgi:hypothetical protein